MRDRFFQTTNEQFFLNHCPSCGLWFQDEEGLAERLDGFYPPGYWWNGGGSLSSLEQRYRESMVRWDQLRFVRSGFGEARGKRLLDIGCGNATFVKQALAAGFDAFGLETSAEARAVAENEVPGRIFSDGVEGLIAAGERFDVLTLFHSLEHMLEPFRFLRRLQRLIEKPGMIFVQVPNSRSLQARLFGSRWYGFDCPRHVYNFSSFALMHVMGKAGYRIHEVRHFSLRDNAASLVSSLFPGLDPMSQRVKNLRKIGKSSSPGLNVKQALYFGFLLLAQPLAWTEAKLGRGSTIMLRATLD
jgi:SAM-dependent methyltransferase